MIAKHKIKIDITNFECAMKDFTWIEYEREFGLLVDEIEKCFKNAQLQYSDIKKSTVSYDVDDESCLHAVVETDDEKYCITETINELNTIKYVKASLC